MSRILFAHNLKRISALMAVLLLSSCASDGGYRPADIESRDVQTTAPAGQNPRDDQATPLEQRNVNIERAEYYQRLANDNNQTDASLSAAEYYIQADDYVRAEQAIGELRNAPLEAVQKDRYDIVTAYIAYAQQDYQGALARLQNILRSNQVTLYPDESEQYRPNSDELQPRPEPEPLSTQHVDALLLSSFCYQALGDHSSAIEALLKRESALVGSARSETTRYTWQVINAIPRERREQMMQSTPSTLLRNRLEQSLDGQFGNLTQPPQQFTQWRQESTFEQKQTMEQIWGANSPRNIAVLLPMTSKFNKASQALLDGIKYQHEQNSSPNRPQIRFYDIGENPYQAPQFYSAALQSGADLIIGPLGKDYANQVNSYGVRATPTILLGGDAPLNNGMTRLTMSPESEGLRVAERALQDGHLTAALLVPNTPTSQRTVDAFSQSWLQNGGKISKIVRYSAQQFDHSVELKQLFDINQSEYRHRQLGQVLGFRPKFSAHQRSDIDFIFMIADNKSGRIVRPQINFFSGSTIPVYSTSAVFNGIQDNINNKDLDDTRFPVMPWVLQSSDVAPYAGQLNMLFAMGSDAYRIAGQHQNLRANSNLALNGSTGQLSINAYGEVVYQPLWAEFADGEAVTAEALRLEFAAPALPRSLQRSRVRGRRSIGQPTGQGSYNDSNWDSRQSRRKTGS